MLAKGCGSVRLNLWHKYCTIHAQLSHGPGNVPLKSLCQRVRFGCLDDVRSQLVVLSYSLPRKRVLFHAPLANLLEREGVDFFLE